MVGTACGVVGGSNTVSGYPDVDLGVPVVVYKSTPERDLHLHVFSPDGQTEVAGAVLFFHGGGFSTTRVPQFERQAQTAADAGIVGIVVEYRVTAEGTTRADAVQDGIDAATFVRSHADDYMIDPTRVALAGSSAGGALAVEASEGTDALVLFNPAVGGGAAPLAGDRPTIVFHSRADTVVPFGSAEAFCAAAQVCELVAFEEGDHGFFNDEPAFSATTEGMTDFLAGLGY